MINLKNVSKIYKLGKVKFFALQNINLEVKEKEFLAIIGPSGSGKTTLMNIIGLLDRPTSGIYEFKKERVDQKSHRELARIRGQSIGFVFQNYNLLPRTTVLNNVILPLIYAKVSLKKRRKKALEVLEEVGLSKKIDHKPYQLSGGEAQRCAIARALVCNPEVILADEPTGNLDTKTSHQIMGILKELNRKGKIVIVVTHEQFIAQYASRQIKLLDGRICHSSVPEP